MTSVLSPIPALQSPATGLKSCWIAALLAMPVTCLAQTEADVPQTRFAQCEELCASRLPLVEAECPDLYEYYIHTDPALPLPIPDTPMLEANRLDQALCRQAVEFENDAIIHRRNLCVSDCTSN